MTAAQKTKPSLIARLLGDPAEILLENRILNGTMLLVFIAGVLSTVQNIIVGNSIRMVVSTGLSAMGGLAGYWYSYRKRIWKPLVLPIYLFFMALLAVSWVTQAGSNGTIGYYFFLVVTTAIVLFTGPGKIISIAAVAVVIMALLALEAFRPDLIMPYATPMQRFADVAFSLIFCLIISATMFFVVYKEYQRERRSNDALLRQVTAEKVAVERAMKEKQRLLSMVCHDIANALMVAQNSVMLAKVEIGRTKEMPHLDRSGFALNNIKEIINSVRMLEAVEQGRVSLELEPVALGGILDKVREIFTDTLARRNMRLILPADESLSCRVIAEPRILANQVFSNLVSNAIRFSYPGSAITIGIDRGGSPGYTAVRVSDNGIGIPAEMIGRLFDPHARTSRPGTNGEPGTGFGMFTVKSFVDLFDGRIEVTSKPEDAFPADHGTAVTVFLKSVRAG